ncbi:MAG: hypothetical protein M1838_004246 [Thelocarpon superellum]|nr:MAG: hypothetical protein M1838_004246 [Thelocarpon superellum]
MANHGVCGPGQTLGFQTSEDLVGKQTFPTTSVSGVKRSAEELRTIPSNDSRTPLAGIDAVSWLPPAHPTPFVPPNRLNASAIETLDFPGQPSLVPSEYTQRRALGSTQQASQNPLLFLSHPKYALGARLVHNFNTLGIQSIYPWQSSCLLGRGLLAGEKNLVYTAPTGGGKSLVADVIMLKRIIDDPGKKAILILPYVALVQEKLRWLRRATEHVPKMTSSTPFGTPASQRSSHGGREIRVANTLINSAIEDNEVGDLGVVVFDELHMLDDDHRGYLIELMATKLMSLDCQIQIVGMSATLSNIRMVAEWLHAKFYESKYRPVPIEEHLVCNNDIFPALTSQLDDVGTGTRQALRRITASEYKELDNPVCNAVVALTIETTKNGYGVLIFCGSRKGCESDAKLISDAMPGTTTVDPLILEARWQVLEELQNTTVGLDRLLDRTIMKGVGFHHAGLTTEERDIISEAFEKSVINVIVATCSLAAGINLPARRVILHGARMGREYIGPAMLRQMRGRAGRKGKDEVGETYLCCVKDDLEVVSELLTAELPAAESSLTPGGQGMTRALLEVIATRLATSSDAIDDYVKRTLLYRSTDGNLPENLVGRTLASLLNDGLIQVDRDDTYEATLVGQAIVASSLSPEDGVFVHAEIQRALRALVMDGEMHIFYLFTPLQASSLSDINWRIFLDQMDGLDESGLRVLDYVGVNPSIVNKMALGGVMRETTPDEVHAARVYRRFFAAFQLRDLCNEVPVHTVARRVSPRG